MLSKEKVFRIPSAESEKHHIFGTADFSLFVQMSLWPKPLRIRIDGLVPSHGSMSTVRTSTIEGITGRTRCWR